MVGRREGASPRFGLLTARATIVWYISRLFYRSIEFCDKRDYNRAFWVIWGSHEILYLEAEGNDMKQQQRLKAVGYDGVVVVARRSRRRYLAKYLAIDIDITIISMGDLRQ